MVAKAGNIGGRCRGNVGAIVTPFVVILALTGHCAGSDPTKALLGIGAVGMSQPRLVYLKPGLRHWEKASKGVESSGDEVDSPPGHGDEEVCRRVRRRPQPCSGACCSPTSNPLTSMKRISS